MAKNHCRKFQPTEYRVHERYRPTDDRQMTGGRATTYSEREREFTR